MSSLRILSAADISGAATVLRNGGLLGLPTETVYGLAANAEDATAVARIYQTKGRPSGHPVIVHIGSVEQLDQWAHDIPDYARALAAAYWPGPLTLVLPRTDRAADFITGGQDTVGIRIPNHPVALAVLQEFGGGLAAPSANQFGAVSPTSALHVFNDLGDRLDPSRDAIIDGGECEVGIESTIIDCTSDRPRILRSGAITQTDIENTTGLSVDDIDASIKAPGTLASHYAPDAKVVVLDSMNEIDEVLKSLISTKHIGFIALEKVRTPYGTLRLAMPQDSAHYATELYAALREADIQGLEFVVAIAPAGVDIAYAVRDRLTRAAH
jgi:L-threonylcarbamoyladenylate synthase